MDALQAEHDKVWNKSQLSKTADQAQDIINALQNARDTIANGMSEADRSHYCH